MVLIQLDIIEFLLIYRYLQNTYWFKREDSTRNEYYAGDTISIYENNRQKSCENVVKGQVRYELNGKKVYVENILSGQWQDVSSYNQNVTNLGSLGEDIHRKPYFIQNVANVNLTTPAENGGYPPTQNGDIRSLFWLFSLMALQN